MRHAVISILTAGVVGSFSVSIPAALTFHRSEFEVSSIMEMPGLRSRDCVSCRDCRDRVSFPFSQGENVSRLHLISASRAHTMAALTSYITQSTHTSSCHSLFIPFHLKCNIHFTSNLTHMLQMCAGPANPLKSLRIMPSAGGLDETSNTLTVWRSHHR